MVDSRVETYPEIVVCGEIAYEWGAITTVAHRRKTGRRATKGGNSMRILRKSRSGVWRIQRAIFSPQGSS